MRKFFLAAMVVAAAATSAKARSDVGLIESLQGGVQVLRPARNAWSRGAVMVTVAENGKVKVAPGGSAVVLLFGSGARFRLSSNSVALITKDGCRALSGAPPRSLPARPPRQARSIARSRVAGGRLGGVVLREGLLQIELLSLFDTATLSTRPTFSWRAVPGATLYRLKLLNQKDELLWQREATASPVVYPQDAPELSPDIEYSWTIEATVGDLPCKGVGLFRILPEPKSKAVASDLSELNPAPDDVLAPVMQAEVYAEHGLLDDALALYQEMALRHPEARAVHLALAQMLADQGRSEEALRHLKIAQKLENHG